MKEFNKKYLYNYTFLCVVTSIILNFVIEACSRRSIIDALNYFVKSPVVFLYNSLIILITFSILLLIRRRLFAYSIISTIWIAGGITNGIVLSNRVTPFTATELKLLSSVFDVMTKYLTKFQIIFICICIGVVIVALIAAFIFAPKYEGQIKYKKNLMVLVICIVSFTGITKLAITTKVVENYFGNIAFAYLDYGFPYCFSNTLLNTGISKPANYSKDAIKEIFSNDMGEIELGQITELANNGEGVQASKEDMPNIIFLQLESFFDPKYFTGMEFSEDPIPYFTELKEKYSSGFLSVPSVGAGTANTEFEVISGMNLEFFGPGEYPYKTILRKTTAESINYDLSDLGYKTHAIHNNKGTFYTRQNVFKKLGFDTFTSIEYMNIEETTPLGWAKDKYLTESILDALNSSENQDFIYTISVQGHGDYPDTPVEGHSKITISGLENEARLNSFEYYINEISEMDDFIRELTAALDKVDEKTVLVMYGDHLPSLEIKDEELANGDIYQTEYVVWSNYDMPKQDQDLEAYQLTSHVLKQLGITHGTLINYHQNYSGTEDYLKNLKMLQYDMLYGNQYIYNEENPYEPTDLQMGVKEISISDVYEEDGNLIIKGNNFTDYSRVKIDKTEKNTVFIDRNTLMVEDCILDRDVSIAIQQVTVTNHVLSTSEKYEYIYPSGEENDEEQAEQLENEENEQLELEDSENSAA